MKIKNIAYSIMALAAATVATSCQTEEIELFTTDDSMVYFQKTTMVTSSGNEGYGNSTSFSFVGYTEKMTSVTFAGEIRTMGKVRDYDRAVKVVVDEENTTMIAGVDYEVDLDTVRIPAGKNLTKLNVKFLRNLRLRDEALTLVLRLEPNENFSVLTKYKSSNSYSASANDTINGSLYSFKIDEVYSCPASWYTLNANNYFGAWTATKFIYINQTLGFELDDWTWINGAGSKITAGRMPYYAIKLQKILQAAADEGNPVYDEDGKFMQLGDSYRVDYSNYHQ
ncbi:MAG: DUF4843 domain-containing protein [Muribaculaceae bacterium]